MQADRLEFGAGNRRPRGLRQAGVLVQRKPVERVAGVFRQATIAPHHEHAATGVDEEDAAVSRNVDRCAGVGDGGAGEEAQQYDE